MHCCFVVAPSKQHVCWLQPSLPAPLAPAKEQSWLIESLLSPGMPVAKVASSLSSGPVHSGSKPSILPSWSSSMQFEHGAAVGTDLPENGASGKITPLLPLLEPSPVVPAASAPLPL